MRIARTRPCAAVAVAGAAALAAAVAFTTPVAWHVSATVATAAPAAQAFPATVATPAAAAAGARNMSSPLTTEECESKWQIACYNPLQYQQAYDLGPLYRAGITGKGRTIVIVDSFGSPTVQHDL